VLPSLLGVSVWLQLRSVLHHDPAWLIHGTEIFLDGGKLYKDVFELNPPLIFYLTVPPVWFARLFGLFDINVFVVYVFLLIAVCLAIVWFLLRDVDALSPLVRDGILLAVAVALAVYPAERFGQREHLMLILSLPYLLLVGTRSRHIPCGSRLAVAIGILAALGFALKPHFLLVPAAVESYLAIRIGDFRRCARPETLALAGTGLLYFAVIVCFTPDYLTTIVPFAMAVYGRGYDASLSVVLARPEVLLLLTLVPMQLILRRRQIVPEIGDVLGIASVCFFAIYAVQMKGWDYQLYPLDATLFLLLSSIFLHGLTLAAKLPRLRYLTAAIGALLVTMAASAGIRQYRYSIMTYNSFMTDMAPFMRSLPSGSSIYVFTAKVSDGFPLVNYYKVGWSSRFDTFWLLPGLIAQPSPPRKVEQFLRDAVVDDLTKQPPALIFVDVSPKKLYFGNRDFDYIKYFSADPRFVRIWSGYEEVVQVGDFLVFRRRAPDAGG
jgi:hypothetical protein